MIRDREPGRRGRSRPSSVPRPLYTNQEMQGTRIVHPASRHFTMMFSFEQSRCPAAIVRPSEPIAELSERRAAASLSPARFTNAA